MKQGVFKYIFVLGFIILLIVTYVVFYNNESTDDVVQDQTSTTNTLITDLRLGIAELDTINPLISNNKNVKEISRLIFDSLVTVGVNYDLEFGLASEIGKEDNLTYIIKLREDVKWQDGSDFTSQDVKFTIDIINDTLRAQGITSSYADNLSKISGLKIIDSYTIKIFLSEEVEFFEYNLTMPILSYSYFENEDFVNTEKNNFILGTGMYQITSFENGIIKLAKNTNYWNKDKDALITNIDVNLYSNIGDMYTAFKSGYIDIMDITVDNVSDYIGSLGYTQAYYDEREVTFLSINTESPLLSDSKTRKALALYIDKTNIIANLGSGYTESDFLLSSKNWIYHSKLNYSTNYEEADNLLKEAGWSYLNNEWINEEGKVLTFSIKVDLSKSDRVTTANVIASQLANHGIEVNVIEENSNAYTSDLNSKNYEVILAGYKNGYSPKITDLFKDDNIANYSSSTVRELVNNIKSTSDYNEKQENYNKLYDEYLNDFPYIFLYRKTNSVVYNQTLCGKITPNAYSIFYNIEKWYRQ